MLNLTNVTLSAIDCVHPGRTLAVLEYCMRLVDFGSVVLLTDTARWAPQYFEPQLPRLKVIHHTEKTRQDYEHSVHREPVKFLTTDYLLHVEWDSGLLNCEAWTDEFLKYDYIGAPWPRQEFVGWPKSDASNSVGNGGFTLKSKKWCEVIAELSLQAGNHPSTMISDVWACRTMRPELERRGIKFATENVAARFSCENRIYSGQFGFHGKNTIAMNNWRGIWDESLYLH